MKSRVLTSLLATIGLSAGCSSSSPTPAPPVAAALPPGIDLAGMDKSVAPGDDFNAYANGGWIKATAIPADKSRYGSGSLLVDQTRQQTIALIQDPANAGRNATPDGRKVADFYASFMDEAAIEAKGIAPLKPALDAIAAITDKVALARAIGGTLRADVDPLNATNFWTEHLLGVWIAQGLSDPEHDTPYLLQGGLGLPDRDYYVSTSPKMAALRTKYTHHVATEISHSFDDQGSQFDAQGRLANWWTPQDLAHFKAAGEALAAQYDADHPFPDLALNGHQVLSENIADLAGLAAAYDAYHLSLNGRPAADQDFFVSFAQSWRIKAREESTRLQVTADGHAPDDYRAATVRNLDPWYAAFSVTPAQKMYLPPEKRVRVW